MNINISRNAEKVQQLKASIDYHLNKAVDGREEKTERFQKSWLYYLCKAPTKAQGEVSDYVEPVVRRAVEALKPSIAGIFLENEKKAVTFRPTFLTQPGVSEAVDNAINNIFLNENDGYNTLDLCITDALVSGDCFMKVFMEQEVLEEDDVELVDADEQVLGMLLEEYPDTDLTKLESRVVEMEEMPVEGEMPAEAMSTTLYTGVVTPTRIDDKIRIERVDFKDIFVKGDVEDIQDSDYICQRLTYTVADLIEMGFKKEDVLSAGAKSDLYDYLSTEDLVNDGVFTSSGADKDVHLDEMARSVYVYEHYIKSSLFDKKGKLKLYQVLATDTTILKICEVGFIPFVHGVIERVPGSFWGVSLYDKFYQDQDLLSRNERTIQANGMFNTYGRYIAVKGGYDRQSLLNNRPGSVIEVTEPGAVNLFPHMQLPSTIMDSTVRISANVDKNIMSSVGVDVTGANMSATAAAITANSADLKDKVMARTLAYTLFRPLFKSIYELMRASDPQGLPKVFDFQVDVNTANDDSVLAQQLVQLATIFAQVPEGSINKQEMAKTITGLSDEEVMKYFPLPPEPTPEQMQEAAAQAEEARELANIQKESAKASLQLAVMEVARKEVELAEVIKNGEAKRLRDEEESLRKFEELKLKQAGMELKAAELAAEVEQERSIGVGQYGTNTSMTV